MGRGCSPGRTPGAALCVGRTEQSRLKELIYEIDHKAFVFITDAHEVLGEVLRILGKRVLGEEVGLWQKIKNR